MSLPKTTGLPDNIQIPKPTFQKMVFITNALEQGWTVKKHNDTYIFTKKHENRQEIFQENYLETFVTSNLTADSL
tara:strand:+ start:1971 stop:2195 length:225 start_codon:yes stop_codon:yes gene_type:complete